MESTATVIDVNSGNIQSVAKVLSRLGRTPLIATTPEEILGAQRLILPGVGQFGSVMAQLEEKGLAGAIKTAIKRGIPFMGICVGLQVLFEASEESPNVKGLAVLKGTIVRFQQGKIPQIGWNRVIPRNQGQITPGYAYFVNSFYAKPINQDIITAFSDYYVPFPAAIQQGNLWAVQFHPEKSGAFGQKILGEWLTC